MALEVVNDPPSGGRDEVDGTSRGVLVVFSDLDADLPVPAFDLLESTADLGVPRLFVRDVDQCWYQRGLRGLSRDVPSTVDALTRVIGEAGDGRRVFVGSGAGGYAAILFGVLCGADEVVAFAPQATITRFGRWRAHDRRWRRNIGKARRSASHHGYLDLVRCLEGRVHRTVISVHFGKQDTSDSRYAQSMQDLPGTTVIAHAAGHDVASVLDAHDELSGLCEAALGRNGQ
jgi:hypothetical protein